MKLFKYDNYVVTVAPEALTLKAFKKIWTRDKSKNKEKAIMELSFLYFFCDPRSDYQYISDDADRLEEVKKGEGFDSKWKPDADLKKAIELYKSFDTSSAILLRAAQKGVEKVQQAIDNLDPTDAGDSKKPPIDVVKSYLAVLKMVPEVATMLKEAEQTLNEEIKSSEAGGAIEKTILDDGFDAFK